MVQQVRRRLGLGNKVILGFSGFVRPWHGLERVIDVVANCKSADRLGLLIVGDGPARSDLEHKARQLGVTDRVRFVGAVDHKELPHYLAAFDIALQPSAVAYACPLKLVEYMAMGKAIIAPDQPNIRELIRNSEIGLLIRQGDATGLTDAILLLTNNPDLRKCLGHRAAQEVRERRLTWEANAERIEAVVAGHS